MEERESAPATTTSRLQVPLPFASPMTAELTPQQRQEVVALLAQLLIEAIEQEETGDDR